MNRFSRKQSREFVIRKTITPISLGLYRSPGAYRKALEASGYRIWSNADPILNNMKVSETETQVDLVMMIVAELGFNKGTILQQIYTRVIELGLEFCSTEVAPALCLAYPDLPFDVYVAIKSIAGDGEVLSIVNMFLENRYDFGRCLFGSRDPNRLFSTDDYLAFVVPHKS